VFVVLVRTIAKSLATRWIKKCPNNAENLKNWRNETRSLTVAIFLLRGDQGNKLIRFRMQPT